MSSATAAHPAGVDLDVLRSRWRAALRAADAALRAAERYLQGPELAGHRARLSEEYNPTVRLLRELAHDEGASLHYAQPFVPPAEARRLLGLPPAVTACVFDIEDVLVGSASLHAEAWTRTFHDFLADVDAHAHGEHPEVLPFDPRVDYPEHLHGRPRVEGVHAFLASRGIRLPDGRPDDAPGAPTVHGLANRKAEIMADLLDRRGVAAYAGSQRYLELAQDAGIRCATVSASAHSEAILEQTGLARLIDARIDADEVLGEGLRGRPAPDRLLAACGRLGVAPEHAAAFDAGDDGIKAGRAGGFLVVVAIDRSEEGAQRAALHAEGADRVVTGLADLIARESRRAARQ
jgi:beta-phosphoglucomutase-like phosphatase (HAD superfamily)